MAMNAGQEWNFTGNRLSAEDNEFARPYGASFSNVWTPKVTHVIASTNEDGACCRSLKLLFAILKGRWVLSIEWMKTSINSENIVHEEAYKINRDWHGAHGGPRSGRLRDMNNLPNLLEGLTFIFLGKFIPEYEEDLTRLIVAGGGATREMEDPFDYPAEDKSIINLYQDIGNDWPFEFGVIVGCAVGIGYQRKPLLYISTMGMIVCLFCLALSLAFLKGTSIGVELVVMFVCTNVAFFSIGIDPVCWVLTSEIFPLKVRAQAAAIGAVGNRVCSGLIAMSFLSLARAISVAGTFFIFSVVSAILVVFVYTCVPETKGKSLEEIELLFQKKNMWNESQVELGDVEHLIHKPL